MSIEIKIKIIPHNKQRYPTVGDYFTDSKGVRQFRISDMKNNDYHFLVILHELIESHLCQKRKIKDMDIDLFDIKYELDINKGLHKEEDEPGFDKNAPYRKEHIFATKIEKLMAKELKVNWEKYDKTAVNS